MKRRDLKIVWLSNGAATNSGYAVESRDILFRLLKDGWNVEMVSNFGNEGYLQYLHGEDLIDDRFKGLKLKIHPRMNDMFGGDALVEHGTDIKANVAFAMLDLHTIQASYLQELNNRGMKFIPYLPIDQDPPVPGILQNLNYAYKIVTFAKYGQRVLQDNGYTSSLILEGIDTEIFKPMDKDKCREELELPKDNFIFGMIGANKENPPRKGFQEALEAFKLFSIKHPEARIFFHTQQMAPGGFPIIEYARHLGVSDKIMFLNPYVGSFKADSHRIAKEINAMDILLHPSTTEGFGLLSIEAQSCGVPVIVNRCMSQPELVIEGVTGEICEVSKQPWYRQSGAYVYPADVQSLYKKMELLYSKVKNGKEHKKIKQACRKNVVDNFNIDTLVQDKWIPFLEDLQAEILPIQKVEEVV